MANSLFEEAFSYLRNGDIQAFNAFVEGACAMNDFMNRRPTYENIQKWVNIAEDKNDQTRTS